MLSALAAVLLGAGVGAPAMAREETVYISPALREAIAGRADGELRSFYAARGYRPLWIDANGRVIAAGDVLLDQVETAQFDGINRNKLKSGDLAKALDRAERGDPDSLARAELTLSRTLVS